jgi:hypothetical protein
MELDKPSYWLGLLWNRSGLSIHLHYLALNLLRWLARKDLEESIPYGFRTQHELCQDSVALKTLSTEYTRLSFSGMIFEEECCIYVTLQSGAFLKTRLRYCKCIADYAPWASSIRVGQTNTFFARFRARGQAWSGLVQCATDWRVWWWSRTACGLRRNSEELSLLEKARHDRGTAWACLHCV